MVVFDGGISSRQLPALFRRIRAMFSCLKTQANAAQRMACYVWRSHLFVTAFLAMAMMGLASGMGGGDALAAEGQHNIPDLSGYWARPEAPTVRVFQQPDSGPGPIVNIDDSVVFKIGDHDSPILLPHAAEAVRAHGDYGRASEVRYEPWALCLPAGVPHALNLAGPIQILQSEDQVTIVYQRGQQIRRIDLNRAHPENLTPSWYGHSVGHYEGNSLVVDTVAQDSRSQVDSFGAPKSEAIRVV
jgi:hypothetical protein